MLGLGGFKLRLFVYRLDNIDSGIMLECFGGLLTRCCIELEPVSFEFQL